MSEVGQKRKWRRFQVMSALPQKADIDARDCDVRFVPMADMQMQTLNKHQRANCDGLMNTLPMLS
jgi:hypothetical protein